MPTDTPHGAEPPPLSAPEWPSCFTQEDIRIVQAVDMVMTNALSDMARAAAETAWRHRCQVFNAILAARNGIN